MVRRTNAWWSCGSDDNYHDLNKFALDTEKCTVCGMDVEEYWTGYEREINDTQEHLGAYRVRRATSRSRPAAAVYVEEQDEAKPTREYLEM